MKMIERERMFQDGSSYSVFVRRRRWKGLSGIVLSGFLALLLAGGATAAEKSDFQFKKQPEIQQVRPQKPVKIRLHRNAKGEYSWDLNGDNVDEIVNTDKKLRKLLKIQ
jgi:hypothetical protein